MIELLQTLPGAAIVIAFIGCVTVLIIVAIIRGSTNRQAIDELRKYVRDLDHLNSALANRIYKLENPGHG